MIDIKLLRADPAAVRAQVARRLDPALDALLDRLTTLDRQRRDALTRVEALKAERNAATEEVARRKRAREDADALLEGLKRSGEEVKGLDQQLREIEAELDRLILQVPNLPLATVLLFMTEIPKGATGKLQRIGLAAKLGLG